MVVGKENANDDAKGATQFSSRYEVLSNLLITFW